jgi:hypothetical protein
MKNYYVTVTLEKDQDPPQELTKIFGAKDDLTIQKDALRFVSGLILKEGTKCTHLQLHKAKIGVVKRDGTINSGKGKLLWETDSFTTSHVITNPQIVITTPVVRVQGNQQMNADSRVTIDPTLFLNPDEIFVFGSNESGKHLAGAAKQAMSFGAIYGQGVGMQGDSYAIPTKDTTIRNSLTIDQIKVYVDEFVKFAKNNPKKKFLVTEIGCGYAGFIPEEIAPLFVELKDQTHVSFSQKFWDVLNK